MKEKQSSLNTLLQQEHSYFYNLIMDTRTYLKLVARCDKDYSLREMAQALINSFDYCLFKEESSGSFPIPDYTQFI